MPNNDKFYTHKWDKSGDRPVCKRCGVTTFFLADDNVVAYRYPAEVGGVTFYQLADDQPPACSGFRGSLHKREVYPTFYHSWDSRPTIGITVICNRCGVRHRLSRHEPKYLYNFPDLPYIWIPTTYLLPCPLRLMTVPAHVLPDTHLWKDNPHSDGRECRICGTYTANGRYMLATGEPLDHAGTCESALAARYPSWKPPSTLLETNVAIDAQTLKETTDTGFISTERFQK